jgi:hypothetical protein
MRETSTTRNLSALVIFGCLEYLAFLAQRALEPTVETANPSRIGLSRTLIGAGRWMDAIISQTIWQTAMDDSLRYSVGSRSTLLDTGWWRAKPEPSGRAAAESGQPE